MYPNMSKNLAAHLQQVQHAGVARVVVEVSAHSPGVEGDEQVDVERVDVARHDAGRAREGPLGRGVVGELAASDVRQGVVSRSRSLFYPLK